MECRLMVGRGKYGVVIGRTCLNMVPEFLDGAEL